MILFVQKNHNLVMWYLDNFILFCRRLLKLLLWKSLGDHEISRSYISMSQLYISSDHHIIIDSYWCDCWCILLIVEGIRRAENIGSCICYNNIFEVIITFLIDSYYCDCWCILLTQMVYCVYGSNIEVLHLYVAYIFQVIITLLIDNY